MSRSSVAFLTAVAALAGGTAAACAPPPAAPPRPRLQVTDLLGGDAGPGFERAIEVRDFVFPADHGPHPGFRTEWWYFTGNLEATDGHRFGYQLTIFRTTLAPPALRPARSSAWGAADLFMGHFALADVDAGQFYAFDRFSRGALGLAGATAQPWHVWLEDWNIEQQQDKPFPVRLRAHQRTDSAGDAGADIGIDLVLAAEKSAVLQGDRGLSRKGPGAGNASYYYSFTRLRTSGSVRVGDDTHRVVGDSWLDREWSTSALEEGQIGWDWFALQLDDATELMFYRIREADGTASPYSSGVLVDSDGTAVGLAADDIELRVDRTWISPIDDTEYPAAWTISVPAYDVFLVVEPYLPQQELDLAFRYWEGAVRVHGTSGFGRHQPPPVGARSAPRPVTGNGYVELTGYASPEKPDDPTPTALR